MRRSSSSPTGRLRGAPTARAADHRDRHVVHPPERRLAWKGPNYIEVVDVLPHANVFSIGGVDYQWNKLIVVLITVPVLLLLVWLVERTRQGKAMRATAQDRDAAAMMGINVNRTISFTFLIAGALAGAAGAPLRALRRPTSGTTRASSSA